MIPKTTAKKTLLLSLASLILFVMATSGIAEAPLPPNPILAFTGKENFQQNGQNWVRYKFSVTNHAVYPNIMFAPAPALPPCGLNHNSSRTWVDLYDRAGHHLQGFCTLTTSDGLTDLWFARPQAQTPPAYVYVVLNDRRAHKLYKSNPVAIP